MTNREAVNVLINSAVAGQKAGIYTIGDAALIAEAEKTLKDFIPEDAVGNTQ